MTDSPAVYNPGNAPLAATLADADTIPQPRHGHPEAIGEILPDAHTAPARRRRAWERQKPRYIRRRHRLAQVRRVSG